MRSNNLPFTDHVTRFSHQKLVSPKAISSTRSTSSKFSQIETYESLSRVEGRLQSGGLLANAPDGR